MTWAKIQTAMTNDLEENSKFTEERLRRKFKMQVIMTQEKLQTAVTNDLD